MQYKPSKWVSGYKHGPAASYTQITRMGLFLNVATSKFEPLDSTWDNLHSGGMFVSGTNKIYFRDETNKDIYINSPADNQLALYASSGVGVNTSSPVGTLGVGASNQVYMSGNTVNGMGDTEGNASLWLNYLGYNYGSTQFRDTYIGNGKGTAILFADGSSGAITAPLQPAFSATVGAAQNDIAIDTEVTIVLGTEIFDQGADFATNTFTAPVTGRYQLNANVLFNAIDSAANWYKLMIKTSNRSYADLYTPLGLSADIAYQTFTVSVLADMDASDTAYLTFQQDGGTAQTDIINSATHISFSGHLAC
jgi:hypothetical protein